MIRHLIFYGSLMTKLPGRDKINIESDVRFVSHCEVEGSLYDLGDYPAFIQNGNTLVKAELYEILDQKCLPPLDHFEGFIDNYPDHSHYIRRKIRVDKHNIEAWIYIYNESIDGVTEIKGGDWRCYTASNK